MKLIPKFQNGNKFYYQTKNVDTGDIYNVYPSAIGTKNLIAEGTLPEVIVPGNKPYKSAFHSEDTLDFINALTGNILGRLSPTQTGRAIYDTFDNDLSDEKVNVLISDLDVAFKQQQQTEERFIRLENSIDGINRQLSSAESTLSQILKTISNGH